MPTLILIGSADIADNQAVAGALVMAIPGAARDVVPDAGHLMYLEKPEVFSFLLTGFLNPMVSERNELCSTPPERQILESGMRQCVRDEYFSYWYCRGRESAKVAGFV